MKFPLLIIAGLFFFACTTPQPQSEKTASEFDHLQGYHKDSVLDTITGEYLYLEKVSFGQNLNWILEPAEKEGVIDSLIIDEYFKYNDISSVQLPLNRYIVADDYKLFIGMIIGSSVESLAELYEAADPAVLDITESEGVVRILNKHEDTWSVRYLLKIDRTYLFSFVSADSVFINEKFENYESPSDHIIRP